MHFKWIPCHRRFDRSIKIKSYTSPLCARCSAVFIGYLFLPLTFLFSNSLFWWYIPVLMIPLLIDGYSQKWNWRESNNVVRIITGFLFGLGQCIMIVFMVHKILQWIL